MPLTNLTKLPRATQTNGRYLLTPIGWVWAGMFAFARIAGMEPTVPENAADPIAPEAKAEIIVPDLTDESTDEAIIEIAPVAPPREKRMQPRPIQKGAFFADLRRPLNLNDWYVSTYTNEHENAFYGGPWLLENVIQAPDRLILKVERGKNGGRPTMAEIQTQNKYGYGRYEVIMRPSRETGIVSTFFTYTGPWSGDPHDEVDIEFVGKRFGEVEYNYWKNGRSGANSTEPLPPDHSDQLNLYAFEWHPDEIIWFLNGEEHYRAPRDSTQVPSHPGKIMISAWTGTPAMSVWTGEPDFGESAQAEYACVSFTPFGDTSYSCADMWSQDPQFQPAGSIEPDN